MLTGAELREFPSELAHMKWGWVAVAFVADILVYVWQGWRWSLLLGPVAQVPVAKSIRAIYVGLFANEILPLKTGEVLRCYLQARWSHLPFSVVLASAVIERIFDGLWLVFGLWMITKFLKDLPGEFVAAGNIMAAVVAVLAVALFVVMLRKNWAIRTLSENGWQGQLRVLIDDLNRIGFSRSLLFATFASVPYLLMQVVPIWAVMKAYDLEDASFGIATVLMLLLRLSSALPQGPGNLGVYNAAAVVALQMFSYDVAFAKRFSLALWCVVTVPLLLAGFVALAITGGKLSELTKAAETVQTENTAVSS